MYLFFGLSGFLITSVIAEERSRHGTVSLRRFFVRRARRLLPALVVFLVLWLLAVALFGGQRWMTTVPGDAAGGRERLLFAIEGAGAALLYASNWLDIFRGFSGYLPLGHLWSLAVEEQVYILWAPLLALLVRRRRLSLWCAVVLAAAWTVEAVWLNALGRANWTYMGTDSRVGAFLLGAAFFLAWSQGGLGWLRVGRRSGLVAVLSLCALLGCAAPLAADRSARSFAVAWSVATLAAPLLVVSVVERGGLCARLLSQPLMTYPGRRSDALYLWHYVLVTWLRDLGLPGIALCFLASVMLAELSWRAIESPSLRRGRSAAHGRDGGGEDGGGEDGGSSVDAVAAVAVAAPRSARPLA